MLGRSLSIKIETLHVRGKDSDVTSKAELEARQRNRQRLLAIQMLWCVDRYGAISGAPPVIAPPSSSGTLRCACVVRQENLTENY